MDGSSIALGLGRALLTALVFVVVVTSVITSLVAWAIDDDTIKSKKPITPELEISVKGEKSDTLYIYREP